MEGRDSKMKYALLANVQATQVIKDTHVIMNHVTPKVQQQSSLVSSSFISKMLNPNLDTGIDFILNLNTKSTSMVDVLVTTNDEIPTSSVTTLPPPPIPLIYNVQQTPTSTSTIALSTFLHNLPSFGSLFKFEDRVKALEEDFSKFKQTNLFTEAISSILGIVDKRRAGKEPESSSEPKEKSSKSTVKSKEGSKSHQKSAGKSAQAEEPINSVEDLEEPIHQGNQIIVIKKLTIVEWKNYKHLEWITIHRDDDKLYTFKENYYNRLCLHDIEDMLLVLVQGKLTNLNIEERLALGVSLQMFTRSIVIQRRVEDLQLGVESYQKKLNLTNSDTYKSDLKRKTPYIAYSNPRAENPVKEILLKLNLPDHMSILKDSKVTPTKHEQMIKPYSSLYFIPKFLNTGYLKTEVKIASLVGPANDPWDQRVRSQFIGKDLVSGLLVYELPLSSLRKKYRLSPKNDIPPRDNIMEYLVKISKKAHILELKQRHLKITVLISNTPYPSRNIRCICAYISPKTMKEQAMKHMASKFTTLDKIKGVDFRRCQKKMHFLLSSISVVYVLTTPILDNGGDDPTMEQVRKRAKWDNDDYVYIGLILNGMSDPLFDIYQNVESSKELWDSLEAKYMAEDALNFKHTMKYKKEELTLIELGSHLYIKESFRVQESDKPKSNNVIGPSVVNLVEHNNSFRYNDNKGKRKHHENTRADPNKKAKPTCWKYGKIGHIKRDCKGLNVGNKANSQA
uniref:Zinc finger, CCHC-type n=1 Tax=Tanacetum cinerariifolium TaxID=118510 RepID=A0A699GSN8_TANCI|nr:zinc finger, CCHC-type [Tanacetum cinerariifolium]